MIPYGNIFLVPPRDLSKIIEDTYAATFYKSMSSAPTNSKIHLVDPNYTTSVKSSSDSTYDPIRPLNLSNSKIRQQIWSHIFDFKQHHKDIKRYHGN